MVKEGINKLKPGRFVVPGVQKSPDPVQKFAARIKFLDKLTKSVPDLFKLSNLMVIWDVYSLVKSLRNDHPVAIAAAHQIDEITDTINNLTEIRDSIKGAI